MGLLPHPLGHILLLVILWQCLRLGCFKQLLLLDCNGLLPTHPALDSTNVPLPSPPLVCFRVG